MTVCIYGSCMNEATHPYGLCKKCYFSAEIVKKYRGKAKEEALQTAPAAHNPVPSNQATGLYGPHGNTAPTPITPGDFVGDDRCDDRQSTPIPNDELGWNGDDADRNPTDKPIKIYDYAQEFRPRGGTISPAQSQSLEKMHRELAQETRPVHDPELLQELREIKALLIEIRNGASLKTPRPALNKFEHAVQQCLKAAGIPKELWETETLVALRSVEKGPTFFRCSYCSAEISSWQAQTHKELAFKQIQGTYSMKCPRCNERRLVDLVVPGAPERPT